MSTASLLPTAIAPTDPVFTEAAHEDYPVIVHDPDGHEVLHERYHLAPRRRDYVLARNRLGDHTQAADAANCMRCGVKLRVCKRKRFTQVRRKRCHQWLCDACGRHAYRLTAWAATRHERIVSEHQIGLEISRPKREREREREDDGRGVLVRAASATLAERSAMAGLSGKFLRATGYDSVCHDYISPNDKDVKVRIVVQANRVNLPQLSQLLKELDSTAWLVIKRAPPRDLLEWCFSGCEPALELSGELRAELIHTFSNQHLVRTTGSFYSPLSAAELRERNEAAQHSPACLCPVCRDHFLDDVPVEEQITESVEDIESEYEYVSWASTYDPFRRLIDKGRDRYKSKPTNPPELAAHAPPG